MQIRPMEERDLSACVDIFNEAYNDVHRAYGFGEDAGDDDGWLLKPLSHLLHTDPEGAVIATDDEGDVAFASTIRRGGFWFLSFLFVRPRAQRRGIGRELLDRLMPPADGVTLATMAESFNGAATGLYARYGLIPAAPKYWLIARSDVLRLTVESNLARTSMSEEDLGAISSLDQVVLGFERADDHRWWMRSMNGHVYRSGERVVGYAYIDDGWISPALGVDESTLVAVFADAVRLVQKDEVETAVFGTSRALFEALMHSGFRIGRSRYSSVYASNGGPLPPSYVLHADWLP